MLSFGTSSSAAIRNQTWWAKIELVIHVLMHMDNGMLGLTLTVCGPYLTNVIIRKNISLFDIPVKNRVMIHHVYSFGKVLCRCICCLS